MAKIIIRELNIMKIRFSILSAALSFFALSYAQASTSTISPASCLALQQELATEASPDLLTKGENSKTQSPKKDDSDDCS
jgi:hypothetical protein